MKKVHRRNCELCAGSLQGLDHFVPDFSLVQIWGASILTLLFRKMLEQAQGDEMSISFDGFTISSTSGNNFSDIFWPGRISRGEGKFILVTTKHIGWGITQYDYIDNNVSSLYMWDMKTPCHLSYKSFANLNIPTSTQRSSCVDHSPDFTHA